jgi:ABC-2 type transport system permease protein
MSTLSYAAGDSATMLRRNLRHLVRYPSMTFTIAWSAGIALLAYLWARRLYSRDPVW